VYEADSGITEEPWVTYNEFFIYDFYVRGGSVYIKIDKSNLDLDDVIVTLDALVPLYKFKLEKAIASKISDIDQLTNIYTRRYTLDRLFEEFERSKRYGESLSMAMIDIDDFKRVNDTYGHDVGDEVLRKISNTLKDSVRKIDIVGRYGGEEFLIIFPHTNLDQSMKSCARILKNVREFYRWMRLTLSIGVVEASSCNNVDDFLKCSDLALYQAKFGGKNRIVKYSE
jgi:diguanylate cyclase (GGDEF)-like protein